jgi:hypothetical protein
VGTGSREENTIRQKSESVFVIFELRTHSLLQRSDPPSQRDLIAVAAAGSMIVACASFLTAAITTAAEIAVASENRKP